MTFMKMEKNRGFAAGNNHVLKELQRLPEADSPPFILLLNPDTVVGPGAIEALVQFMQLHPQAGIAGASLVDAKERRQSSAHHFPSPAGEFEGAVRLSVISRWLKQYRVSPPAHDHAHACDWVSGAALMIRRSVVEQIGLLDEGYFLYFEEVDWCLRAKRAGWEIWSVPQAEVLHLEGASTGMGKPQARRSRHWYDSRRRYFKKHLGKMGLFTADLFWSFGWSIHRLRQLFSFGTRKHNDPKWLAWDLLSGDVRAFWRRLE
jgi:hypothetical protein